MDPPTNNSSFMVMEEESGDLVAVVLLEIIICFTFLLSTILNTLILVIYYRRRGFRTLSNRFVLNFSTANLLTSFILTPLSILDQSTDVFLSSQVFCSLLTAGLTLVSSASLLATLLIGLDQYMAIVSPLHYHRRVTRRRVILLCSAAWILSLLASLAVILD